MTQAKKAKRALGPWFRTYASVLNDRKLDRLSDAQYRLWNKLLAVACKYGGIIPDDMSDLKFELRLPEGKIRDGLQALLSAELLERIEGGYVPHNWEERQFESDVSTSRVKRFRERSKKQDETVSRNVPETEQRQNRTEKKEDSAPAARVIEPGPLPDWIPKEAWDAFVEMRKRSKAPLTARAIKLTITELDKLRASGQDPGAVLEQSVMRSYRGIFPIADGGQHKPFAARESPLQQAHRIANELANTDSSHEIADHGEDHRPGNALPQIGYDRRRA